MWGGVAAVFVWGLLCILCADRRRKKGRPDEWHRWLLRWPRKGVKDGR